MEDKLSIRKADAADIAVIKSLAHAVWPQTYRHILTPGQIAYMLELLYSTNALTQQMKQHTFLLAETNGMPVGFASYSTQPDAGFYKLHKLYVNTRLQGKGVGSALIQYIVEALKALHAKALDLNVNRQNKARLFYERLGFNIIKQEDIDIGQGYYMNDYVMRLEV